jgi:small-conductance mechanosensitive channel
LLLIDGNTAFVVTEKDLDPLQSESLDAISGKAALALEMVIAESRESRDLESMVRAAGWSALATFFLVAILWGIAWARDWVERKLVAVTHVHAKKIELGGLKLVRRDKVVTVVHFLLTVTYWVVAVVLFYRWVSFVLGRFPVTRVWGEMLDQYLLDIVVNIAKSIASAVPGIFTALIIFLLARSIVQLLDSFFERVRTGQLQVSWLEADVAEPTKRIAKTVVWLFALAMTYPYLPGAQTEAFKGLSVLVGLMVSLGASNLVGQAASGLILTYGRVYRKGEYVRLADHEGTVTELGVFATRIRTGLGEELTISNSTILGSTTKNYSRAVEGKGYVLDTTVTIGYDTPWRQVHSLLIEAALRTEGVKTEPAPNVFQIALSDWYPQYRLVCQAIPSKPQQRALILSELLANIQDVFHENGVQIMSPHYVMDPNDPKLPPDAAMALAKKTSTQSEGI